GGGGRHSGAGQVDLRGDAAHAAHEVAVGGGHALLAVGHDAHVAPQAGAAGGGGDGAAGVDEGGHVAQLNALLEDVLGGGHHDAPHVVGHLLALQDLGGHGHVLQPAVGAGADDHLVDLDLAHFGDGVGVLRQVGEGHGGLDGAKVNLHGADVLGVGVGLVGGVGAVHPAV